jgi:hypothetical protein
MHMHMRGNERGRQMHLTHCILDDDNLVFLDTTGKPTWVYIPVDTDAINNAGDLIDLCFKHDKVQLWVLPGTRLSNRLSSLDDSFVTSVLETHDIFPKELAPFLQGWRRGTHGDPQQIVFTEYMDSLRLSHIKESKDLYATLTYIKATTGVNITWTSGNSCMSLLKQLNSKGERKGYLDYPTVDLAMWYEKPAKELSWSRPLTPEELDMLYLHSFDVNAAFLARMKDVHVGRGDYVHKAYPTFDRKQPGKWHITISGTSPFNGVDLPHPTGGVTEGWFSTGVVQSCKLVGYQVDIQEAYLWPNHHTTLKPLYERLRDARDVLSNDTARFKNEVARLAALETVKRFYSRGTGLMGYPPKKGQKVQWYHRPDIRDAVVEANNNYVIWFIQQLYNAGCVPVGVSVDDIFFLSNNPNPLQVVPGMRISNEVGDFRHKYTYPLKDVAHHITSNTGVLMRELANYRKEKDGLESWED